MKDYLMLWNQTKEELKKSIHENTFNQIVSSITEVHCVRNNIIYLIVKDALAKFRFQKFCLNQCNHIQGIINLYPHLVC